MISSTMAVFDLCRNHKFDFPLQKIMELIKDNDTLVFSMQIANVLLRNGYKIKKLKPNRNIPNATVYVFEGDIKEEVLKLSKALDNALK